VTNRAQNGVGCIIRSVFLKDITQAFRDEPELDSLLFNKFFNEAIHKVIPVCKHSAIWLITAQAQPGWRRIVAQAAVRFFFGLYSLAALSYAALGHSNACL